MIIFHFVRCCFRRTVSDQISLPIFARLLRDDVSCSTRREEFNSITRLHVGFSPRSLSCCIYANSFVIDWCKFMSPKIRQFAGKCLRKQRKKHVKSDFGSRPREPTDERTNERVSVKRELEHGWLSPCHCFVQGKKRCRSTTIIRWILPKKTKQGRLSHCAGR